MATRMQQRRGTAAQWTAANPILAAGEIGFETDTSKFKMGNGSSAWTALTYFANAAELAAIVDGAPELLNTLNELALALGDDPNFVTNLASSVETHATDTTNIHGVADMTALATTSATTSAISTAVSTHNSDTTLVHGIADTSALALTSTVTSDISTAVSTHNSDTTNVHGIADTSALETTSGAQSKADAAVLAHQNDTTNVHGIADTSALALASDLTTHSSDTTMVHGIADTSALALQSDVTSAISTEVTNRDTAISTHNSDTTAVHGIADTSALALQSDVTSAISTEVTNRDTAISTHNSDTTNVHGIADTADLATLSDITSAISGAAVDQSLLAGVGIEWNTGTEAFDIDSTVATKTYADGAVSTHDSDTTNVHGIADTSALALTATVNSALALKAPLASPTFTGTVSLPANTIQNLHMGDDSVGTNEISGLAVTTEKIADSAVTSAKIADLTIVDGDISASAAISQSKISGLSTSLGLKADLASPALTGVPTAPTAAANTNTTQVATTAFVGTAVADLVASAPTALNTLNELATALGNDAAFSTTVTNSIGLKAPLASPTFTGTVTVAASGVAFTDGTQTKEGVASRTPIVQKTAAYTLSALTERDSLIEVSSATGVTITIPTNTAVAYPIGTSIDILQTGAGQVTIAPEDGTVTVNSTPGLKLRTTWSSATLFKRAANTWVVFGDLTA